MTLGQTVDRKYNISIHTITTNQPVSLSPTCNGWTAINIGGVGAAVATVNGIPLNPRLVANANGESFSIGGNENEVYSGRIDVAFTGANGILLIIEKFYL